MEKSSRVNVNGSEGLNSHMYHRRVFLTSEECEALDYFSRFTCTGKEAYIRILLAFRVVGMTESSKLELVNNISRISKEEQDGMEPITLRIPENITKDLESFLGKTRFKKKYYYRGVLEPDLEKMVAKYRIHMEHMGGRNVK